MKPVEYRDSACHDTFFIQFGVLIPGIVVIDKIDILMWTKDGEAFLPMVLRQIRNIVPREKVCHKILVDDHSTDSTVSIAQSFGWEVYPNPEGGIPSGANEALSHVDTDFFMTVEQDVVLSTNWWPVISKYLEDPNVACAQGIRLDTHPILSILDEWAYGPPSEKKSLVQHSRAVSMDNNIFRTEIVRSMGGFPRLCPVCTDTAFRKRIVCETNYQWIIDAHVISQHIRNSLKASVEHDYRLNHMCARTTYCAENKVSTFNVLLRMLLTSPLRGFQIAVKYNYPNIIWDYPLLRLYMLLEHMRYH